MNTEPTQSTESVWSHVIGGGVVASLLTLIALTAVAGWPWVAKFLESSAPAWIQAVGSVAAIVAAIVIVQRQHTLEIERRKSDDRSALQRRARALRVLFFSAARTCEGVARRIGRPHQTWRLDAAELRESRSRLIAVDPMLVPHGGLLMIIEECAMRLQTCATIVAELETPRPKHVEDAVRLALMRAAKECWLGLFEAIALESKLAKNSFNDSEPYSFEDFEESRKALDKIRAEFVRTEEAMSTAEKDTPERTNRELEKARRDV